jgi:3-oxoacyl-[acyl-carrier protein] reductase
MSDFKQLSRSVRDLTVLVTGAASGMGRATARVFAAEGAKVAVTDTAAEGAQAVAAEITARGEIAKAWTLDVASRDDINAVVNDIAAISAGSILSSTMPASRYAPGSTMTAMTRPGPGQWR